MRSASSVLSRARASRGAQEEYMILRTFYLTPSLDEFLRKRAFRENKSKNAVIREILLRERKAGKT